MPHYYRQFALVPLAGITLALSACATGADLDVMIHQSDRGAVYIERIPDRSFQAAHPFSLSTYTMARVLRGVVVEDSGGALGNLVSGKQAPARAFEEKDIEYLAPLLVEALARAASDQQVGFGIVHGSAQIASKSSGPIFCLSSVRFPGECESEQKPGQTSQESTEGSLYAYGQSLYLTITGYRHPMEQAEMDGSANRRIFNSTGLSNRAVRFVPESAKRPDSYRNARSTDATLVIDYNLLAAMPVPSDMQTTAAQPAAPAKGESSQRDADLEAVRMELQEIKKKLAEQEEERARSLPPSSKKPASRSNP